MTLPLIRRPRVWLPASLVVLLVTAALAGMYLGGTLNNSDELRDFPIAIVNEDEGAVLPTGESLAVGTQITQQLLAETDEKAFDLHVVDRSEAESLLDRGELYGAVVLPHDLSSGVASMAANGAAGAPLTQPTVTVLTNPRAGVSSVSYVSAYADTALAEANAAVASQLTATLPTDASELERLAAGEPLQVLTQPYNPLPAGTGGGLSAFYFALLLLLAGFTGSMISGSLIDARLGFVPAELGPIYRPANSPNFSRLRVLSFKWALMGVLALLISAMYLGIAAWIGMPIDHPAILWLAGALAIFAIAVAAQAIIAAFGNIGLIVNLFIFIILALPSSGGTVPLEATPPFFRWLSTFEPLHQIYSGTRSILYFDATWDSGLDRMVIASVAAAVIALVAGAVMTRIYDRRGLHRSTDSGSRS